jgi:hypothetical protein
MVRKSAWFLNFDADDELARPSGYSPSQAVLARFNDLSARVRALLLPGDVLIADGQSGRLVDGFFGMAWCPTPRARRALLQAGAAVLPVPALDVLQAVNHRRFSAALGQTLPGARFALTLDEVEDAVANSSPTGQWLLKRPFGFAGRGRLRLDPGRATERDQARAWINASLRGGDGLQVEPLVERAGDFALHGYLLRSGEIVLGEPTEQDCDAKGAWKGSARAAPGDLEPSELDALLDHARLAGTALRRAGYWGPFGVDAFLWKDKGRERRFNPRCEINARYSMGWAIGMGDRRPDVEDREDEPNIHI